MERPSGKPAGWPFLSKVWASLSHFLETEVYCLNQYKVCVYAICKNEEQFVERWMDAVQEADLVVVLDTGSLDKTVERLRCRGAQVSRKVIDPWRFDTARNLAMDLIPLDVDICVSNDLDEVFEPGWRKKLEMAWAPGYTRARYRFTWSYYPDGSPNQQFMMEKIHRRHDFHWVHPVHEILEYSGEDPDRTVFVPSLVLNHHPDLSKPRAQYLPLLELSAQENPSDDRTAFWLGREYICHKKYDQAIQALTRHLSLPSAQWDEERSASMRLIAQSYLESGNSDQARRWLYRSIAECPTVREPFLYMARLGYAQGDWPLVLFMVEQGLAIERRQESYLLEPEAWQSGLYDYGAIACYRLQHYERALEYAEKALGFSPEDKRLQSNLNMIRDMLEPHTAEEVPPYEA